MEIILSPILALTFFIIVLRLLIYFHKTQKENERNLAEKKMSVDEEINESRKILNSLNKEMYVSRKKGFDSESKNKYTTNNEYLRNREYNKEGRIAFIFPPIVGVIIALCIIAEDNLWHDEVARNIIIFLVIMGVLLAEAITATQVYRFRKWQAEEHGIDLSSTEYKKLKAKYYASSAAVGAALYKGVKDMEKGIKDMDKPITKTID